LDATWDEASASVFAVAVGAATEAVTLCLARIASRRARDSASSRASFSSCTSDNNNDDKESEQYASDLSHIRVNAHLGLSVL
jgi:hypothetical protein